MANEKGVVSFFTGPNTIGSSPLRLLLFAGYVLSTPLSAGVGFAACRLVSSRWVRFAFVPVVAILLVGLAGIAVVVATGCSSRYLLAHGHTDWGTWLQYANTSGMQMTQLDRDTWFHVLKERHPHPHPMQLPPPRSANHPPTELRMTHACPTVAGCRQRGPRTSTSVEGLDADASSIRYSVLEPWGNAIPACDHYVLFGRRPPVPASPTSRPFGSRPQRKKDQV